jgi:UDP-glucuronate 4-epimerase
MRILVTGAAGFIGSHVAAAFLARGDQVIGFDNFSPYYDPELKKARVGRLLQHDAFEMLRGDLLDGAALNAAFDRRPARVVHLAAQPGVRYSLTNPQAYIDSNVTGTLNVLEACRRRGTDHLVYASSSSVYGANTKMPFSTHHNVDHPVSLYAATKKAAELLAHTYSHLYSIPTTGLRFFTVYGPWGRPDMAPSIFARAIFEEKPLEVFNEGRMQRDFTFIDDIVEGVLRVTDTVATTNDSWSGDSPDPASSAAPYRLYNIGSGSPVSLMKFIQTIEMSTGKSASINLVSMQPGDVKATFADVTDLATEIGIVPRTPIETGVRRFVDWYREYYYC